MHTTGYYNDFDVFCGVFVNLNAHWVAAVIASLGYVFATSLCQSGCHCDISRSSGQINVKLCGNVGPQPRKS